MRRRGRPGLMGTVARTAVVAGTASATANAVNRRAQKRAAADEQTADQPAAPQQPAAPAPEQAATAPASAPTGDLVSQLTDLGKLRDSGVLTPEEFDAAKAKLLA
jgi:putative oligomerization/nucleic acid binding protein